MSDTKKNIYKPSPISGFPEWLPQVRRVEQQWFDHIRAIFESYGFCNIETPSVETLDALNAKGNEGDDVDKEVYVIERLHKEDGDKEARLALHFDQTVPLARYTAQHFNELVFPFKRYQMQRVWRGERPQAGRFREFYQCDIDVIAQDELPLHFDAEMPAVIWEVLSSLPGMENEEFQIQISNRKILMGFLDSIGVSDLELMQAITRYIDKLDKLPQETILTAIGEEVLQRGFGVQKSLDIPEEIRPFIEICAQKFQNSEELNTALTNSRYINTSHPMIAEGLKELAFVMDQLLHLPKGAVVADLSMVRGLDYYTGTVYETRFIRDPLYGSICSGGRYDDLASSYINKKLPGVGISIGFSRLFDRIRQKKQLPAMSISPADVMVVLPSEELRSEVQSLGQVLRKRGFNVEVFHAPSKIKRQMAYAEKKGIPFVWFPPFDADGVHEVKNMSTGEQTQADAETWVRDA
jgi:histidyl-tRNA synthetase